MKENALILFLKLPSGGKVKTRLEKDLGPDLVLALYNAFIIDILHTCGQVNADTLLAYSPDSEAAEKYQTLLDRYTSFEQRGSDLGERMYNAFTDAYIPGYRRSVLIGSDIPDVKSTVINEAFSRLEKFDITLGPSADGGYYLIGNSSKSNSDLFYRDIEWSRPDVYEKTALKIESLGYSMFQMEMLNDIDDLSDLVKFYVTNKNNLSSESVKLISENLELIFGEQYKKPEEINEN